MLNVTKEDIDNACAGFARAVQEYPRREGIRVALLSVRQMNDRQRELIDRLLADLDNTHQDDIAEGRTSEAAQQAETLRALLGLPNAE